MRWEDITFTLSGSIASSKISLLHYWVQLAGRSYYLLLLSGSIAGSKLLLL